MKTLSRRRPAWAVSLLALFCVCASALPGAAGTERGPKSRVSRAPLDAPESEARVIVKYKRDAVLMRAAAAASAPTQHAHVLSARLGMSLADGRSIGSDMQVLKARGLGSKALADRLRAQDDVEFAEVDGRKHALAVPNDPLYAASPSTNPAAGQWYLRPPTSATIADQTSVVSAINAEGAWNITRGLDTVVVAVLDTGVRLDHPDLASKLRPGYDFIGNTATANDGDGRDGDASDPGDGVTSADVGATSGCTSADVGASTWHGTQTAGLIGAATDNAYGMAGAGRNVMLLPVRVLGKCGGFDSDIQAAMLWAGGVSEVPNKNPYPAKVINLSLGSTGSCSDSYRQVIKDLTDKGVSVVVAAGNDGLGVGTPANCPGAIAVAGVRHAGTKVGYSDLGPEVAVAAPAGNCVNEAGTCLFPLLTTSNSGSFAPVSDVGGGSIFTGGGGNASLGTSFSAPLVSGTIGLMLSANTTLKPAQVLTALRSTARPFPSAGAAADIAMCNAPSATAQTKECYCTTTTCGAGLTDASAATLAVSTITALIGAPATTVAAGSSLTLDARNSWPSGGAAGISAYQWAITDGAGSADLAGATSATPSLQAKAPGTLTVALIITDTAGRQATSSVALTVTPRPESSGGGALQLGWLLAWMLGVGATALARPRRAGR